MDTTFIIGITAAVLTTISFVPQVVKAARTRQTKDLSLAMYVLFCLGVSLWLVYGLILQKLPIVAANGSALALGLFILYLKIKYK